MPKSIKLALLCIIEYSQYKELYSVLYKGRFDKYV